MGIGGISIWQLLIILAIIIILFGTKRLRNFGGDLGAAIKGFRKSLNDGQEGKDAPAAAQEEAPADSADAPERRD